MRRPPHVCIVCCQHVPDDVRVTHKEGMAFRQAGFRVTWVGPQRPRSGDDYGINFRYYPPGRGKLGRLLHYRKARQVAGAVPDVDVYVAVEPDSAVVAVQLARRHRARAVFDIHEVYHDEMLGRWFRGPLRRPAGWYVRRKILRTCDRCDLVTAVSRVVMAPYAATDAPTLIVRNCAPVSFAEGEPADVCGPGRPHFTLMHGKSTAAHGTPVVVEALGLAGQDIGRLRAVMFDAFSDHPEAFGRADFEALAARTGAEPFLDLRPKVPMSAMPGILRSCDAGIIAYNRTWGVRSLPNKLFEYMAAGLPVIAPHYAEEIRPIVEQERCGLLVDCERPEEIAQAIRQLHGNPQEAAAMGRRGREGFLARHNWQVEIQPLIDRIRHWADQRQTSLTPTP